jgi:predicted DNA-binding transcriptional regulator YafY
MGTADPNGNNRAPPPSRTASRFVGAHDEFRGFGTRKYGTVPYRDEKAVGDDVAARADDRVTDPDDDDVDRGGVGPRYEPAQRLLKLALMLTGTRVGLTIDEMSEGLGVGRRTAERLKASLTTLCPQIEAVSVEADRATRWRLPRSDLAGLIEPKPETLAAIETAAREYEARGETERASLLRDGLLDLRATMRPETLRRAEPDIDALMEAEGIAMRPGPRATMQPELLRTLRQSILSMHPIRIAYCKPDGTQPGKPVTRILCPYGILYGGRGWLVAHVEGLPHMRLWRLDRIQSVNIFDRTFTPQEGFSLPDYAAQSFGVFQEAPIDVVLRFSPEVAADAAAWVFHPTQSLKKNFDGSLSVTFRAGGKREICWHLIQWGASVSIASPKLLSEELVSIIREASNHHGAWESSRTNDCRTK